MKPFFFNRCFEKNNLKALIAWSLLNFGERKTLNLVEKLKNLGFMYATQAGISLSLDDLKTPPTKIWLISEAEYQTATTKKEYYQGNLTAVEKFQQLIDTWHRTSELLKEDVIQNFKSTDILNPVYMMAFSGARGNISQVRQLVGMRGLMADPQGQIIDFPIRSNFREGLTLTEYVISCYGARKGLVDTALRTANSGYLTRRLVDVSQHVIIGWMNCGTTRGISLGNMIVENKIILPLQNRLVGRVLAEDIKPIAVKNQQISLELAFKIAQLKETILVRSPLTCKHKKFLCQFCYGWSLAYGNLVAMGEAVGVLAAQSIGEPGTQLTMRTFHTGGVFSGGVVDEIRAPFNGFAFFNKSLPGKLIRTSYGKIAFFTKKPGEVLFYPSSFINPKLSILQTEEAVKSSLFLPLNKEQSKQKIKFFLPECTILFIRNAGKIYKGQLVAEFSSITDKKNEQIRAEHRVYSEIAGQIFLKKTTQLIQSKSEILTRSKQPIASLWILSGKIYKSSIASPLFLKKGDYLDSTTTINQSLGFTTNIGIISSYLAPNKFSEPKFSIAPAVYKSNKENSIGMLVGNEAKQIVLKQPLQNLLIKTPHYKKFSYFFSIRANQIGPALHNKSVDLLFTTSSLKGHIGKFSKNDRLESLKKPILYEWFPQIYQTKTAGLLLSAKLMGENFNFDKVLFWISEESYQIPSFFKEDFSRLEGKRIIKTRVKNRKLIFSSYAKGWNSRETPFFSIKNRQAIKKSTYLKASGFFQSLEYLPSKVASSLNSPQNKTNFKEKEFYKYLEKDFFLSFTLSSFIPLPSSLVPKRNGSKSNNFIFLTKKNIVQKLKKVSERRTAKKNSFAFQSISLGLLTIPPLCRINGTKSGLAPLEIVTGDERITSTSLDKDQKICLLTFNFFNSFSLASKKLHHCFFQRVKFFSKKNRTHNKKGFLENPLFLIKITNKTQLLSVLPPVIEAEQKTQINQDPFKQFSFPTYLVSCSDSKTQHLLIVPLGDYKFTKKQTIKKEIQITFLNFYRKLALKKTYSSNLFHLLPFLYQVSSNSTQAIKKCNDKKGNIESHLKISKKFKVKSGWVYFPQDENKILKNRIAMSLGKQVGQGQGWNKTENIQCNNSEIDNLAFDQQIIFTEYLRLLWHGSTFSKQKRLNLNTVNNILIKRKDVFLPLWRKIEEKKSYLVNDVEKQEQVRAIVNSIKDKRNFAKNSDYNLFRTKKIKKPTLRKTSRKHKNSPIFELKFQLGLSSFFLNKEKDLSTDLLYRTSFDKKLNKVIVSSRENQEFHFKLASEAKEKKFLLANFRKSFENTDGINLAFHEIKKTNPWVKRNLQLIINKKDDPLGTGKIRTKLHFFYLASLTKETVKEVKKSLSSTSIHSLNTDLPKKTTTKTQLTLTDRLANIVFFSTVKEKNEKNNFKKRSLQKKAPKLKINSLNGLFDEVNIKSSINLTISSITNNPYNMFSFGIAPSTLEAHQIVSLPFQLFCSLQERGFTNGTKGNQISKHQKKLELGEQTCLKIAKPKVLVLFRKIIPYSLLDARPYKKRVYSSNKKEIFFESLLSSNFTRQRKTKLFSSEPSHDLQIKRLIPLGFQKDATLVTKFFDKIVLQRLTILASPSNNLGLNAITTQIQATRVNRKGFFSKTFFLSTYSFSAFCVGNISSKKARSSFTKETWISTNRPTFLTDYLSPYKGEIAKAHSNSSCIIITNADQITVSTSRFHSQQITEKREIYLNKPFAVIGQLIRSGEEIAVNNGLLQSGQVIQIETGKITLRIAYPLLLSFGSIFHVQHTSFVERKAQLFTLFYQIVKTGDIVQGIPKIEQLFEARGPLIEGRGTEERHLFTSGLSARFWRIYLNYSRKFSNKIAVRKSFEEIQQIIVQEVYMVYQEQGVNLAEKHLEIIVRQMTSFVLIVNPGGTRFLPGEILPLPLVEKANNYLLFLDVTSSIYHSPYYAQYVPVLFGITKAALRSEGFISAASFQETTRVLSQAAIEKRKDYLRGLKENVVLGRVIPAGTGFPIWRWKKTSSSLLIGKENPKGKLQSVMSRFDAESLDSLML